MTDPDGQKTNFSMASNSENSNAKREFIYKETENGEETGLNIILTHKSITLLYLENKLSMRLFFLDVTDYSDEWSEWSECSATCGEGMRTRTKMCLETNKPMAEKEPCPNIPDCNGKYTF